MAQKTGTLQFIHVTLPFRYRAQDAAKGVNWRYIHIYTYKHIAKGEAKSR